MRICNPTAWQVALFGLVMCACGSDNNGTDVVEAANPNVDFTAYKTFAFAQVNDGGTTNIPETVAVNLDTANAAMKTQLEQEGLKEVTDNPDLWAFSLASTNDKTDISWSCVPGYWYGYWGYPYDPCAVVAPSYTEYTVGTLLVGLNDPKLEKTVFGGVAQNVLDGESQSTIDDNINSAVSDIFDSYPADQTGK